MRQLGERVDLILQGIDDAGKQYHQLVLLVGKVRSGKTSALQAVHSRTGALLHNTGVQLSKKMLELRADNQELQTPGHGAGARYEWRQK